MRTRNGFTLLELIAALSVTGLAMLGGLLLVDQLTDSGARIVRDGARVTRSGNGDRLLRRLLADASANTDSTKRFRGDTQSFEIWTQCDVSGGWSEPCRAELMIDERSDSSVVLAQLGSTQYSVRRQAGQGQFRYYDASGARDSLWVGQWSSNVTLPRAIGLVLERDTIVLPVGGGRD